jgi:alginate O-acetyltransferase complex protein AlgI
MLFTELRFLVFFAVTFVGTWALRGNRSRKWWLLLASYVFYAGWDPRFLSLLFVSTAGNYLAGEMIVRESPPGGRRAWLAASLVLNLGLLGIFKYLGFFLASTLSLLDVLGLQLPVPALQIALPVGISFFTFQAISYTVDVYRRRIPAAESRLDFALFIALFPHLVAGPVVRASELLPQFVSLRRFADVPVRASLGLFLAGFIKKACIADRLAAVVDPVFSSPGSYGAASKWLAAALYHVQIYCDFSGYTDMAIAVAALLGYALPQNFDFPYLSHSVRDFWRRWHMTLTRWFRDYLYIPLGGSRGSPLRTARNLVTVFLLCGLWHGASWSFVSWGALHGALLVLERGRLGRLLAWLPAPIAMLYVNLVVMLAWVLFRSPDFARASTFLEGMFGAGAPVPAAVAKTLAPDWALALPVLLAVHLVARGRAWQRLTHPLSDWAFAVVYAALLALTLPWVATSYKPFIYFQF